MSVFQNTIDLLGDDAVFVSVVERTISEFKDDVLTYIGITAFQDCSALTIVDLPNATYIGNSAFQGCSGLTIVDLPKATSIGTNSFNGCSALTRADLPKAETIGDSAFRFVATLTSVILSRVTTIGKYAFQGCSGLTIVDLPQATNVANYAFRQCSNLKSLILRSATPCALVSTYVIGSTPIESGTGYIYVPRALVDSYYKTATNWTTFANQFRALEDYTVDGTITGELDPTKI